MLRDDDMLSAIGRRIRSLGQSQRPPASAGEIEATEKALGFPLSELLRLVYSRVANAGFGPGQGRDREPDPRFPCGRSGVSMKSP
jgi:hypothetical protein